MSRTAYDSVLANVKDAADLARVHEIAASYSLGPDAPEWTIVALFREGGNVEMRSMIESYRKISDGIIGGVQKEYRTNRDLVSTSNTEFLEQFKTLKTDVKDAAFKEIVLQARATLTKEYVDKLYNRFNEEYEKLEAERKALKEQKSEAYRTNARAVGLPGVVFGWIIGLLSGSSTVLGYFSNREMGNMALASVVVLTLGIVFSAVYFARKGELR